ncbi:hypothetical protein HYW43_00170 [Candidatus Daviesbacteria bacterium]|nr:hypothetical protein [Candidatus Daviesbacteria bacterium]
MSEYIVYINETCHTGQLRDASHELLEGVSQIVDTCKNNLHEIDPSLGPQSISLKIRAALSSLHLSPKAKESWNKKENSLVKLMVLAGVMSYPQKTNARLHEVLQPVPFPRTFTDASAFLSDNQFRIHGLQSDGQRRLDSLRWAAYAYTESAVLRKALYDGICLTQPNRGFMVIRNNYQPQ